jgi:hypothetical protein
MGRAGIEPATLGLKSRGPQDHTYRSRSRRRSCGPAPVGRHPAIGVEQVVPGLLGHLGVLLFKVFGLIKIKMLLAFTLAAYNLDAIRSFLAKMAVAAEGAKKPRTRRKRLEQTWRDVIASRPESGPDPPVPG